MTDSPSARSAYFSRGARRELEIGGKGTERRQHKVSRVQVNVLTVSRANRSFHFGLMYGLGCTSRRFLITGGASIARVPSLVLLDTSEDPADRREQMRASLSNRCDVKTDGDRDNVSDDYSHVSKMYAERGNRIFHPVAIFRVREYTIIILYRC